MSGFVKRERMVNTINPAGGINLAQEPNVGQYGWTNYDSAVVNQLIQYAELAKTAGDEARESATYVQEQLILVDNYTTFIMDGLEDFEPKYTDSLTKYATLADMYANIEHIHEVVVKYHEEIAKFSKEAYDSAQDAKSWRDKSYVIYLNVKGELTEAGNWNPSTGAFPTVPNHNTLWTVPEGVFSVVFDKFTWDSGDGLVYILKDASFNQLKGGL